MSVLTLNIYLKISKTFVNKTSTQQKNEMKLIQVIFNSKVMYKWHHRKTILGKENKHF